MTEFRIEKGVPPPRAEDKPKLYPFHLMEVGDSFWISERVKATKQAAYKWASKKGQKYMVKAMVKGGVEGIRIWRIK